MEDDKKYKIPIEGLENYRITKNGNVYDKNTKNNLSMRRSRGRNYV